MKYEIKAIIFDLDGVLVETKDLHFEALNKAISKFDDNFIINYQDHLSIFDGMSTKEKLKILCEKGLRNEFVEKISLLKQEITNDLLNKYLTKNNELISLFEGLKDN